MDINEFKREFEKRYNELDIKHYKHASSPMPGDDIYKLITNKDHYETLWIILEECAELQKAVTKVCREGIDTNHNREQLIEEIADVTISIELLQWLFDINDIELKAAYDVKMKRNLERL